MSEVLVAEAEAPMIPFQKEIVVVVLPTGEIQMNGHVVEFAGADGTRHAQPKVAPMQMAECMHYLNLLQAGIWAQQAQPKGRILTPN